MSVTNEKPPLLGNKQHWMVLGYSAREAADFEGKLQKAAQVNKVIPRKIEAYESSKPSVP